MPIPDQKSDEKKTIPNEHRTREIRPGFLEPLPGRRTLSHRERKDEKGDSKTDRNYNRTNNRTG